MNFKQIGSWFEIKNSPGDQPVYELIKQKKEESAECLNHFLDATILNSLRRYRRGKNRCLRCGLKK